MKPKFLSPFTVLLSLLISCTADQRQIEDKATPSEPFWNLEKAKRQASDFNSPEKWDTETLEMEIGYVDVLTSQDLPLFASPFPTPTYESPGNGNSPVETEIGGKKIIGQTVTIGRGDHSEYLLANSTDDHATYFTILTIADGMETENPLLATSRNHPHYVSQGSLNTSSKSRVDWVAAQLADRNAYAIVNTRLFDLRVGRLILVAPQKDGSIRFYQSSIPIMSSAEHKDYIDNLDSKSEMIDFFKNGNNI